MALAGLLLVLLPPLAAAATPLQDLLDGAPEGGEVVLPAGVFEGPLVIDRPLTVRGAPVGETKVVGPAAPVVDIVASPVVLDRVALEGPEPMVRVRAPGPAPVLVRDITGSAQFAAEGGAEVQVEVPVGTTAPRVRLDDARVTYGHPLDVRVTYADGLPGRGVPVQLWDGGRLVSERVSDDEGRVLRMFVPDRWQARDAAGAFTVGFAEPRLEVPSAGYAREAQPYESFLDVTTPAASPAVAVGLDAAPFAIVAALAALGAAVALRLDRVRWPWLLLFAPLYTRLARKEILQHGTREALYGYLEEHPGASLRQLGREVGLRQGTLLHHLQVLERERYVRSVRDGQYKRFYVAGALPAQGQDPLAERVLHIVRDHPGISNQQVAEVLDKPPSLVHYHLERLAEAGRVRKERAGRVVHLFAVRSGEGWAPPTASAK